MKIDIVQQIREPVEVEAGRHTLESGLSGDSFLWEFLYPNRGRKMLQTTSNTMDYTFHPGRWSIRAENGSEVVYFEIIVKSGDDPAV